MFASSSLQRRVRVSQLREIQGPATGRWSFEAGLGAVLALMMMRGEEREVDCFADLGTTQGEQTTPGKFTAATD
jgi:hypothetical protein